MENLTIKLGKRIDTTNYIEVEKELLKQIAATPHTTLTLDAETDDGSALYDSWCVLHRIRFSCDHPGTSEDSADGTRALLPKYRFDYCHSQGIVGNSLNARRQMEK